MLILNQDKDSRLVKVMCELQKHSIIFIPSRTIFDILLNSNSSRLLYLDVSLEDSGLGVQYRGTSSADDGYG